MKTPCRRGRSGGRGVRKHISVIASCKDLLPSKGIGVNKENLTRVPVINTNIHQGLVAKLGETAVIQEPNTNIYMCEQSNNTVCGMLNCQSINNKPGEIICERRPIQAISIRRQKPEKTSVLHGECRTKCITHTK